MADLDYHVCMSLLPLVLLLAAAGPNAPVGGDPQAPAPVGGAGLERVVERVVAVIRSPPGSAPRPLTWTRLDQEARVVLVGRGGSSAAEGPLDAAARRATLHWLIDQWLVADEALRLKVDDVPGPEVQAALQAFRQRFPEEPAYRRFLALTELPEDELLTILARGLRVQRFLDNRLGRGVRVSEEEITTWLAGQGKPAPTPAEREAARARLAGERVQVQVRQVLADLRGRADVRVLVPELRDESSR
jgi:hypothetical protein